MRGKRAKQIRKDVRQMIADNPEVWEKYGFKKLCKNAKLAWKQWEK